MSPIHSMTGYGVAERRIENHVLAVAIQTLNSRNIDIKIEAPTILSNRKLGWSRLLAEHFTRGRIVLTITTVHLGSSWEPLRQEIIKNHDFIATMAQELSVNTDTLALAITMTTQHGSQPTISPDLATLDGIIEETIQKALQTRQQEGERLATQLKKYLSDFGLHLEAMKKREPFRREEHQERLEQKIKARLPQELDRTTQEAFIHMEKIDIEEELVRLEAHMDYFTKILAEGGTIGKKLLFTLQEMARETNTIGAKAQDAITQHLAVEGKNTLEQIREQLHNIL